MKKATFFQDTKADWFPPDDESEKGLYDCYVYATQGGIVRLTSETPSEYTGICTGWLQICLGLLIIGERGKASIIHVTPQCGNQPIVEEIRWLAQVSSSTIAYNPKEHSTIDRIDKFVSELNFLLLQNELPSIVPKYQSTQYGSIAYNRETQTIILPRRSRLGSSQWPLVRENVGLINDFFYEAHQPRLEFNGNFFEKIPNLATDAKKIFNENKELLAEDIEKNKILFKNKLFSAISHPDNMHNYFFSTLRKLNISDETDVQRILTDVTKAFFDYSRGVDQMTKDFMENFSGSLALTLASFAANTGDRAILRSQTGLPSP